MKKSARSDLRLHSFCHWSVNRWNSLTQEEVVASSLNSFKTYLEKRRLRKMDFFMDELGIKVLWMHERKSWYFYYSVGDDCRLLGANANQWRPVNFITNNRPWL